MKHDISATTTLLGLFGFPVRHSISPKIHNLAFSLLGLDYVYLNFEATEASIASAIAALRTLQMRGVNITMPCKQAVIPHLDQLSTSATLIGAVNTVVQEKGVLTGHNTDGIGFFNATQEQGVSLVGNTLTVIGLGGSATAICAEAALQGVGEIAIFNRYNDSFAEKQKWVQKITQHTGCTVQLHDLAHTQILQQKMEQSALLVNATNVGMGALLGQSPLPSEIRFPLSLVVSDLIYQPKKTALLEAAQRAGCQTFHGLWMLLHQAAAAFRLFTGQEMPVDKIRNELFS